ncbi:TRAP transporter large permease [Pontibacillus salicampi]|uniref:TRAP transporter large permease n=1 Tax=Pontibacillus salicampi TaxID=1449801 RepID=UPI003670469D
MNEGGSYGQQTSSSYPINYRKQHFAKKLIQLVNDKFEEVFIVGGFLSFIILINLQVLNRYILPFVEIGNITTWTEEVSRYMFIYISYLGASLAIKKRESIEVNILVQRLPYHLQQSLSFATSIFMGIFSVVLIYKGFQMILMQIEMNQTSPALGMSMAIPYSAVPIGFSVLLMRIIQIAWEDVQKMVWKDVGISILITSALCLPFLTLGPSEIVVLLFGYFIIFILIGMPIAFALGISTLATAMATGAIPLNFFSQAAFTSIDNFPVMAIPFFVAAGILMGGGKIIQKLLKLSDELLGFLPGGLALVAVVTSMFFSAISGSGPATVAAIGTILIPTMVKQGYSIAFSTAIIATAGSIGVIIPPSNPFVIYGVSAQQSISKLFIAGIFPGLLTGVALMVVSFLISKKNGWRGERTTFCLRSAFTAFWDAKLALIVPFIILGGIYGGVMTPTEAAAVAAAYGLIIGMFVYKDLNWRSLYTSLSKAGVTSSVIIMLIVMATLFGRLITLERMAEIVATFVLGISENTIVILLLINLFLLVVGFVLEALAAIVILTPILMPMVIELGIDPIHFGIIMVFNLAIGFITPPVGVNLFVAAGVAKINIEKVIHAVIPLLLTMLFVLIILTYIPSVSLWLVSFMK